MLSKGDFWVRSYNSRNNFKNNSSSGKWIYEGKLEFIVSVFSQIDDLVEAGVIVGAKYAHKENPDEDLFAHLNPLLCVYADKTDRSRIRYFLSLLHIEPLSWKYNWETTRDWAPGGALYQLEQEFEKKNNL